jgi:hypothetical protein
MLKKRIPTFIGLLLLLAGAIAGVLFINQGTNIFPKAAPEYTPRQVKITNVTDTGFVVSWVTEQPSLGFIRYGESALALSKTATDDRDQLAGSSGQYRTHYVTIQGLKPSATYYFKLGSQDNQLYDDNGQPFSITLPASVGQPATTNTAFGTVLTQVDTAAEGAIVYLTLDQATPLSALVKQNGNFATNLSIARTPDYSQFVDLESSSQTISILVQTNPQDTTQATTSIGNHQPVPTIILGQANQFSSASSTPTPTPTPTSAAPPSPQAPTLDTNQLTEPISAPSTAGLPLYPLVDTQNSQVTITSIPEDGTQITSLQPEITGTAPPNTQLTITVHSPVGLTATISSDASGNWTWLVPQPLTIGDHTLVLSYQDESGLIRQITRHFTVSAIGLSQVDLTYTATPSASPTPTPTPTPTPSASPTPTPTPTPTPESTPIPEATPRAVVATQAADIVAGSTSTTLIFLFLGSSIVLSGLVFIKRLS